MHGTRLHKHSGGDIQIHLGKISLFGAAVDCICVDKQQQLLLSFEFTFTYVHYYITFFSGHVLTEDTVVREVREDGKLHSKRILTKTNRVPKWGERLFKAKFVCIVEESVVDPKNKTLVTYTRNIGFNTIMVSDGRQREHATAQLS